MRGRVLEIDGMRQGRCKPIGVNRLRVLCWRGIGPTAILLAGCKMAVPIHVWEPPALQSTVGKRVVVSPVAGRDRIADALNDQLLAQVPRDTGRKTTLVDAASLQPAHPLRLVSATDEEPSDLVLAAASKQAGYEYSLRGEILADRYPDQTESESQNLTVSWRLMDLQTNRPVGGKPISVDLDLAIERYPDLAAVADPQTVLITAAVRETYGLVTPSVQREQVQLAIPYLTPGSRQVRRGNAAALAGRWNVAREIWSETTENHPTQTAAFQNLAIAAAAAQDFSTAKRLARMAVRRSPFGQAERTLVWIELKQRAYHQAFGLPDPPEGWFITSDGSR